MPQIGHVEKSPEWRILVDRFLTLEYGELVPHEELAGLIGIPVATTRYYHHTAMAMHVLLREHDRVVTCVPKQGYKRLEPGLHGRETRRYVRLGKKRIARGKKVVRATPFELLSEDQRKALEHAMLEMRALEVAIGAVHRSFKNLLPPVAAKAPTAEDADPQTAH